MSQIFNCEPTTALVSKTAGWNSIIPFVLESPFIEEGSRYDQSIIYLFLLTSQLRVKLFTPVQ